MLILGTFFLLFSKSLINSSELPSTSTKIDPNTILVLFGTRHGNRNPEDFLPGNSRSWGFEGVAELTSFGKRQGYGLGVEMRKFIGNLTSRNFNTTEAQYFSSTANRCQMTIQTVTAALHIPETWGDWDTKTNWSPVPYTTNDPLLRMYSVKECTNSDKVWALILNDQLDQLQELKRDSARELAYFQANTGWNMSNLEKAADLADNLIEIDLYNATYPNWIEHPTLSGYNSATLKAKIRSFSEVHSFACANYYAPCRSLMAGLWLNDLITRLEAANSGNSLKIVGYASHSQTLLSVMKLLGIEKEELTTSAGFVIEFKKVPNASIRILNHDPNPIDQHVIYPSILSKDLQKITRISNGFIPLTEFVELVKNRAFSDWKSECSVVTSEIRSRKAVCLFQTSQTV
ncbi:unnamed protein product [Caenorhabditis angaria]|uniref:Uncharacterized protein n=1 Tax=Caenorhabditis angaria TaxID=860376 RepID=A0A9P1N4L5_9PELO|nr:unnamed protein product [Caenorhabditis angaria]